MAERILPRQGVITLYGYGIRLSVDRGHLVVEDRVGPSRRWERFARVGHGVRRVVVIGSDGFVSFSALRWLANQNAAFVMLERDGRFADFPRLEVVPWHNPTTMVKEIWFRNN